MNSQQRLDAYCRQNSRTTYTTRLTPKQRRRFRKKSRREVIAQSWRVA